MIVFITTALEALILLANLKLTFDESEMSLLESIIQQC